MNHIKLNERSQKSKVHSNLNFNHSRHGLNLIWTSEYISVPYHHNYTLSFTVQTTLCQIIIKIPTSPYRTTVYKTPPYRERKQTE